MKTSDVLAQRLLIVLCGSGRSDDASTRSKAKAVAGVLGLSRLAGGLVKALLASAERKPLAARPADRALARNPVRDYDPRVNTGVGHSAEVADDGVLAGRAAIERDAGRIEDLGGDRLLWLFTFYGKAKRSGVNVTQRYANVVTFRDGLIIYQVGYGDWESALEAMGLEG